MLKISKQNNALIVIGENNDFYVNNGQNSYPLNSLIVVIDDSDMATFRSVATNDVLFSGLINNITINGEAVTKDNIIAKFDAVSNSSTGGGGGGTVDAYTKEEADNKFASKDELTNVQTVANEADTKVDALTPRVESVETSMNGKQDTLVSGTNIKTINNQSILGEGNIEITGGDVDLTNYYTKTEADNKFSTKDELTAVETVANNADAKADAATSRVESVETALNNKQDTLVSGTNIKTINSQSILGSGDLTISGGAKIYEASEMPTNFKDALYQVVYEAYYTINKVVTIDKSTDVEEFLSNLKTGDYLQVTEEILIQYYGIIDTVHKFAIKTGKEIISNEQYGRLITVEIISNRFYIANNESGPVLQKNDLKTINSESIFGSGDIQISGVSEEQAQEIAKIPTLETNIMAKQDTLVSGTNIKTINGNSILGEGNLVIEGGGIDLSNYYNKTEVDTKLDTKQNTLVSGTNIKTVNSQSILGEGNIEVTIPDATTATSGAMSAADKTKLDSISNEWTGTQSEFDALATKDNNTIYYVTE